MFEFIKKYNRYKRTVKELSNMSNRELQDIGVNRYDIYRIAKESTR